MSGIMIRCVSPEQLWEPIEQYDSRGCCLTWVDSAEKLVAAAAHQGLEITTAEADMMLGYMEGHEYSLLVDSAGSTVRHDEQYGDDHRGDQLYPIQAVIEFCQEMNEDLIRDDGFWGRSDEDYLLQLRQDERAFEVLMARATIGPYQIK